MNNALNMAELTDEQLFIEYVDHQNQSAFAELHRRHVGGVTNGIRHSFFFAFQGQDDDIVQQAFAKAALEHAKYDRNQPFLSWLCRIAKNEAINEGLKRRRVKRGGRVKTVYLERPSTSGADSDGVVETNGLEPIAPSDKISAHETLEDGDVIQHEVSHDTVYELVQTLNDEDRRIITLLIYDGLNERDAAVKLGITRHKLRYRAAEIREQLKQKLAAIE